METRYRDWLSSGLLFLLLQVAAARLVATDWAPFLYFPETLAALGVVLGIGLGLSRFGRRAVTFLVVCYTAVLLPWQLTGAVTEEYFLDRLGHVGRVLLVSLNQFLQRQPVKEPLLFILFVCLVFWLISVAAGYWLARYGAVLASIGLAGGGLVIVQAYANYQPRGSWWLAVFCLLALLLVGRVRYLRSMKDWTQRRVFVKEESWSNIVGSLLMTGALAILIAWLIPTSPASVQAASDSWNSIARPLRDRLSNAVTSLSGPYGKPGSNYYGSTLNLGQTAASGDDVVFTVKPVQGPQSTIRYYWQGRVYDVYTQGRWSESSDSSIVFQPRAGDLKIPDLDGRSAALLDITSQFPSQNLMYAPSSVVWVDRPANVAAVLAAPESYDALYWEARAAVPKGGTYEVKVELSNPTVEQLRAAGETYPAWINNHYLEVPASIRPDLQRLAQTVTVGTDNAYDKAAAITSYLRASLQYSTTVPAAPQGQDPTLWVLQTYKKAFCNYYASAEVLLLRSIGIPARLAVGFAHGELQDGTYTVRRRDSHAWPEVYFPGYGWVEFEPTVNQDPLVRPGGNAQRGNGLGEGEPSLPQAGERRVFPGEVTGIATGHAVASRSHAYSPWWIVGGVLLVILLAFLLERRFRVLPRLPRQLSRVLEFGGLTSPTWLTYWDRWNQLEPVERYFASINWSLGLLGKPQPVHATPAERARALTAVLPSASDHIEALRSELESGLYTRQSADIARARRASLQILLHGFRARFAPAVGALDGRDVYSGQQR